jgi:hypothetical protein
VLGALTADELAAVQAAADRARLPVATLIRSWIVRAASLDTPTP